MVTAIVPLGPAPVYSACSAIGVDMDAARALAEQTIGEAWSQTYRYVLVDATPMRPGRGGRAVHPKRRRRADRGVVDRFDQLISSLELGLGSGEIRLERARHQIDEAGLAEFIRIAGSREEAVETLAGFYAAGYYLWEVSGRQVADLIGLLRVSFATRKELT